MRRSIAIAVLLLAPTAPRAHARPGDLDRSFANGGRSAFKVWGSGGSTTGLRLVDGVRPLLSVQAFRALTPTPTWLQLTGSGKLAARTPLANVGGYAPLLAGDDALSILGEWRAPRDPNVPLRVRVERPGSPPVELTLPADVGSVQDFGVDGAGRIVVLGEILRARHYHGLVTRFEPSGQPDTAFGAGGRVEVAPGSGEVIVKPDGRLFVMSYSRWLTALDPAGQPARGFAQGRVPRPTAKGTYDVNAFIEGPAGGFLLAGTSRRGGWLARLRPDGRIDRRFGTRGYVYGAKSFRDVEFDAIARDQHGRLVVAGALLAIRDANPYQATVLRFSARGRLDRRFATGGRKVFLLGRAHGVKLSGSSIDTVAIDRRGRIVVAGEAFDEDFGIREDQGNPYPAIARLKG